MNGEKQMKMKYNKDEIFWRQLDILNPKKANKTQVTMIGCGGIGSVTSIVLGKIGIGNIHLYDKDNIEIHNYVNQFFSKEQIKMKKVSALKQNIVHFSDESTKVRTTDDFFTIYSQTTPIVVSGVDSMESRKSIWKTIQLNRLNVKLYIDARMGAEVFTIFALDPANAKHIAFYEQTLYSDEEAEKEKCTAKAIAYNTFVIAGLIGSLVSRYVNKQNFPNQITGDLFNFYQKEIKW